MLSFVRFCVPFIMQYVTAILCNPHSLLICTLIVQVGEDYYVNLIMQTNTAVEL